VFGSSSRARRAFRDPARPCPRRSGQREAARASAFRGSSFRASSTNFFALGESACGSEVTALPREELVDGVGGLGATPVRRRRPTFGPNGSAPRESRRARAPPDEYRGGGERTAAERTHRRFRRVARRHGSDGGSRRRRRLSKKAAGLLRRREHWSSARGRDRAAAVGPINRLGSGSRSPPMNGIQLWQRSRRNALRRRESPSARADAGLRVQPMLGVTKYSFGQRPGELLAVTTRPGLLRTRSGRGTTSPAGGSCAEAQELVARNVDLEVAEADATGGKARFVLHGGSLRKILTAFPTTQLA